MKNRLIIDLHENAHKQIRGRVSFPADGTFCIESMAEVVAQFAYSLGMAPTEVAEDLYRFVRKEYNDSSKPPPTAGNG